MKTINDVQVGDLVTNAYDNDFAVAIVKLDEQGRRFYANREIETVDEADLGSIIPVSDFYEDHLA